MFAVVPVMGDFYRAALVLSSRVKRCFRVRRAASGVSARRGYVGHIVLIVQSINSVVTNRHFVILYPNALPRSIWVFLPIEIINLALIGRLPV